MSINPAAALLSLVADAFGGRDQGVPGPWRRVLRQAAPPASVTVLRPLFEPGRLVIPDCLVPTEPHARQHAAEQLDRIGDLDPDVLLTELHTMFPRSTPARWRPVVRAPRAWLGGYARVARAAWQAFAPIWRRAEPLLEREVTRVGVAAMTRAHHSVLATLSPRMTLADGVLSLPDTEPTRAEIGDRALVLAPLVSGTRACAFRLDDDRFVWLGYPLPGLTRLDAEASSTSEDALRVLLGTNRAAILRLLPSHPTLTDLAAATDIALPTISYHCSQLEAAGLARRQRQGRWTRLHRSERGDALVDLLS